MATPPPPDWLPSPRSHAPPPFYDTAPAALYGTATRSRPTLMAQRDPPKKEDDEETPQEDEDAEDEDDGARGGVGGLRAPPGGREDPALVPGVLYLPCPPPGFGPRHVRAMLRPYGELGRVFFQPKDGRIRRRRRRPTPQITGGAPFSEGWVEFRDKRAAKRAAKLLNGAPMSPRPRSPFRHHRWSLKYLPGFRWPHLSERLSYERQVQVQRLRAEVAQAKREGAFYTRPPPKSAPNAPESSPPTWGFAQRATEEEIWGRKARPPPSAPPRSLLEKVFGGKG
ncbi:activator of basal transcription 1 [Caloenas nicobarica]|uniref:activator of basal transcription 1 n=1 Tax=Caloenas nicobarica TaxID=187106 RepID=UPI0032B799E1